MRAPRLDDVRLRAITTLTSPAARRRLEGTAPLHAARARFVAGPSIGDALAVVDELGRTGRRAAIHPLPAPEDDRGTRLARCLEAVRAAGAGVGVVLAPVDVGLVPGARRDEVAATLADLVGRARSVGSGITLRTARPGLDDLLLDVATEVAGGLGDLPAQAEAPLRLSVMARRHRAEADCARLAEAGIPVRLVRGGPREAADTAWADRHEADLAYVRCLSLLLDRGPRPTVATQDPLLLEVTDALAEHHGRDVDYQMYYGAQPDRQVRTADAGHLVRVLVPYGPGWYDYLADLAERPSTGTRLVRVLAGRG